MKGLYFWAYFLINCFVHGVLYRSEKKCGLCTIYICEVSSRATVTAFHWQLAAGMLTSQTDGKSAWKHSFSSFWGKSQKSLCLPHKTVPCTYARDDISLATPGSLHLAGKPGCCGRQRAPVAPQSLWLAPKLLAPWWWTGGEPSPHQGRGPAYIWLCGHEAFFILLFPSICQPTQLLPSASACVLLQMSEPWRWCWVWPVFSRESPPVLSLRWNSGTQKSTFKF